MCKNVKLKWMIDFELYIKDSLYKNNHNLND
jgi:hypothetical protein